jgi:hypothetical protein
MPSYNANAITNIKVDNTGLPKILYLSIMVREWGDTQNPEVDPVNARNQSFEEHQPRYLVWSHPGQPHKSAGSAGSLIITNNQSFKPSYQIARGVRNEPTPGVQMLPGEFFPSEPRDSGSREREENCTRGKEAGIFFF